MTQTDLDARLQPLLGGPLQGRAQHCQHDEAGRLLGVPVGAVSFVLPSFIDDCVDRGHLWVMSC